MIIYDKPLNNDEWSKHYNIELLNYVINCVKEGNVSIWSKELLGIIKGGSCLEIGCGSGMSSLFLAKNGANVTALDYTESSCELVKAAASKLEINSINIVNADATKDLPFNEKQFDYIFQAGLLEHFDIDKQIELLKNWSRYCKYMISMIPNKSSIAYRVGKKIMEDKGAWEYGLEVPKHSFIGEFEKANIDIIREYTIGDEWAELFLPKRHYVRKFYNKLRKDGFDLNDFMQGYLLVTIGKCK